MSFLGFLSAFLFLILFRPTAASAISVQLTGPPTLVSAPGTQCGLATYRFATNTSYNGQAIDLLVEVLSENSDYTASCIILSNGAITLNMIDNNTDLGTDVFMDLKITVVQKNTNTPVEVDRLAVSAFDLDSAVSAITNLPVLGTDDVYFQNSDGTFIAPSSNVTPSIGSFFGGQYQTKLKGANYNCPDSPIGSGAVACRGAAIFVNGANGPNTVSSVTLRVQNDSASNNFRLFQLSFDFSYIDQLVTNIQDYGDADTSYGVAGATASTALSLGTGVLPDHETSHQFSATANGDDTDGSSTTSKFDDEDAVKAKNLPLDNQTLFAGTTTNLDVKTFGIGYLSAWLDLNRDGDFLDAGEKVANDISINSTTVINNSVPITIPSSATSGNTAIRFRFTSTAGAGATGFTGLGEVEDYQVAIAQYDFGDAPDTGSGTGTGNYQTTLSDGGAAQAKITTAGQVLSLGSNIDSDNGSLQNSVANADDNNGTPDDEDGVATFPVLTTLEGQTYVVPVSVSNTVSDAHLVGYLDFNQDGDFDDPGEKSTTVAVPSDNTNPR
ncbi:MAG: GEVED domain-containing protein, partial [Waterburya sp.]